MQSKKNRPQNIHTIQGILGSIHRKKEEKNTAKLSAGSIS